MKIVIDDGIGLQLSPVGVEDQPQLCSMMDTIYRQSYRHFWMDEGDWYVELSYGVTTFQKELGRSRNHYFFAEVAGMKAGILKYDFPFSPRQIEIPNAMKLHRLYLDSAVQGTGIAKSLVAHCEFVARENKLETIWLEVMACQPKAKRFYQKMGFDHLLSYQLDFERLLPAYRSIEIWKKDLL